MARILFVPAIALSFFVQAADAQGDDIENKTILRKGHWQVVLSHDTSDGSLWCSAETLNTNNQNFALAAFDHGGFGLLISDPRWDLRERPVRFYVDIDRTRWTIDGTAGRAYVSLAFNDLETASEFTMDLMRGDSVSLYNDSDNRLGIFSLNGSYAAISELVDCWGSITANRDPFTDRTDPFGASSDPF